MRAEEIVVGDKERDVGIGAFSAAITVGYLIGELESSIEAFDDLFEPAIFRGNGVVIGKANDLNEVEIHVLEQELLLCKLVGVVTVSGEFQGFTRELFELGKGHSHSQNARTDVTGAGYLITEDRLLDGIHNEPDIVPNPFDFCVGFIGGEVVGGFIVIIVNKRLYKGSSCLGVIAYHYVRNFDSVHFPEGSGSSAGGKP